MSDTLHEMGHEPVEQDHIDRFLAELEPVEGLDFLVEGIVDRISGIGKRIIRNMERVLAEQGLSYPDYQVLGHLRNRTTAQCSTPGSLAKHLDLSSGATTSRIDRLEAEGFVRRRPDPDDRRGVKVELTDAGRAAYERAVSVAARRERFFASALTAAEQEQLNALLRKLMLAFERAERDRTDAEAA